MSAECFPSPLKLPPSPLHQFSAVSWCRTVVFRWRGSVAKVMWREMSIVIIIWYMLDFLIRFIVDKDGDKEKEIDNLIQFMRTYQASTRTLLSFMLVFYYQQVSESSKRGKERGTHFFSRNRPCRSTPAQSQYSSSSHGPTTPSSSSVPSSVTLPPPDPPSGVPASGLY